MLGTLGIAALLALAIAGAFSLESGRAAVRRAIDLAVRENAELKVRQRALRERAFDLADLINRRAEQGRRIGSVAGAPSHAAEAPYPRPPDEDAGDEALVVWLSEQGEQVEALGDELDAVRLEMGAKNASLPAPDGSVPAPMREGRALRTTDAVPAGRHAAAPPQP